MPNLPPRLSSLGAAPITRRHALGAVLAGTTSLLAACGRPATATTGSEAAFVAAPPAAPVAGGATAPGVSVAAPAAASEGTITTPAPNAGDVNPTATDAVAVLATIPATVTPVPTATD